MSRKERDSYSATSSTSKMSVAERRNPKPPRFSLRRFFCRRPSARSVMSTKSNFEIESRSVASFHLSHERESQSQHNISVEEANHNSIHSSASGNQPVRKTRSRDIIECPLCLQQQPKDSFPAIMTCHHRSCRDCLRQYLKIEITESRVNIACPECAERFHPNDIRWILDDEVLLNKYEEFMIRRVLVLDPDTRWCPAPDCGYAVIATGCASCPKLKCERPGCDTYFCYHCKQHWHPNQTCDAARARRSVNMRSSSLSYSHDSGSNRDDIKPCPRCGAFIVKMDDGSCNHMTCAVCGADFCWLCMKEISELHYLSPSGCTFWGTKPWSRKKKILWQLGTLVGAPVGIALMAGIAVPAMIIGIPVWVGRKLHTKYEHAPRHKRHLVMIGGVTAAILISPVIAALAVGIGVPVLLAYVYGVVPISLCRASGCGVTTTDSGGVRFEFDDETDVAAVASGPYSGEAASVEHTAHVLNPSIGPSIGEMSMGMTNSLSASGSHMDRIGIIHEDHVDRESASHRAIASESLTGSLSGSTLGASHRVDVQAEVITNQSAVNKRASLSSESANLSLDAKSATISIGDNASTKALAGSICTKDKDNNSAIVPPIDTTHGEPHPTPIHANPIIPEVHKGEGQTHTEGQTVKGHAHTSRQGSPTSSRSVSFLCDETNEHSTSARKKKFKLQSVSVGDCIHEQGSAESGSSVHGHLSIRSLNTDVATSHMDLTPPNAKAPPISPSQIKGHFHLQPTLSETSSLAGVCLVKPRCYSTDSCHSSAEEAGLPQVESDRLSAAENDRSGRSVQKSRSAIGGVVARQSSHGDDTVRIKITGDDNEVKRGHKFEKGRHLRGHKQHTVYFQADNDVTVRASVVSSSDSDETLPGAVAKQQGLGANGDTLSNRSTSSSDNSTCGLLKKNQV